LPRIKERIGFRNPTKKGGGGQGGNDGLTGEDRGRVKKNDLTHLKLWWWMGPVIGGGGVEGRGKKNLEKKKKL